MRRHVFVLLRRTVRNLTVSPLMLVFLSFTSSASRSFIESNFRLVFVNNSPILRVNLMLLRSINLR